MATPYYTREDLPAERFLLDAEGKDGRYAPVAVKRRSIDMLRRAYRAGTASPVVTIESQASGQRVNPSTILPRDRNAIDPARAAEAADDLGATFTACTPTERRVLRAFAENVGARSIIKTVAAALGMAPGTVQAHMQGIRTKARRAGVDA